MIARLSVRPRCVEDERYRQLAHNMTDVITCHDRNGAVRFVSPAAGLLFGLNSQELIGHGLFDRVHVGDRPAFLTALADSARCGEIRSVEFRVRRDRPDRAAHPTVEFIWIEMRCRALDRTSGRDAGSHDQEVVAVMRDITERKDQEDVNARARVEVDRANAAKSRFLATMSHELRTPLNAIIGFSEMLTKEDSLMIDAARRRDYAHLINESGHHLLSVVNGILDMSKIENESFEIAPEPFAPRQVIEDCCDLLTLNARESGLNIVRNLSENLPDIVADKRSFNQILINLISNAIKFTGPGGTIAVGAKADGSCVTVTVEDTGVGIAAEDLPRIGDPFFQARSTYDRRHDGTGLGLSIVKGLLALHGGDMHIDSRLGKGTRVTVRLPIDCERSRRENQPLPTVGVAMHFIADSSDRRVKLSA